MATDPVQASWDAMFPHGAAVQWVIDESTGPISFKVPYIKVLGGTAESPYLMVNGDAMPHPLLLRCTSVERVRTNPVLVLRVEAGRPYPFLIGANIPKALADDSEWKAQRAAAVKEDYSPWL